MFYSLQGEPLDWHEFIKVYEPLYFITSTPTPEHKLIKNKTSLFVEKEIEKILKDGLSPSDIPLILAWKIGNIDHGASASEIVYKYNCNMTLKFTSYKTINAKPMVEYIINNYLSLQSLAETNPEEFFIELYKNKVVNFGVTYILTLLYFFSNSRLPIYDRFAHVALLANKYNIMPKLISEQRQTVPEFKQIDSSSWKSTYNDYRKLLRETVGKEEYIDRSNDRSLWVYGHAFKTSNVSNSPSCS